MSKREEIEVGGRKLSLSNRDKVFYAGAKFTKGDVLDYYRAIADVLLPHLRNRPLTLKRYPDGVEGPFFYEKNAPAHKPEWVKTIAVPKDDDRGEVNYILCNDLATLLWVTNLADIEKHVLLARAPDLDRPTSIVFDLDPGEGTTIIECGRVALQLKETFDQLGLESFVKVSGSKGLHLGVPLNTKIGYETTQPFAKAMAELAQRQMPDLVVTNMAKKLRRKKVLIDWSQNSHSKTTVCVYALRAKGQEPFVSLPITWDELEKAVKKGDAKQLFFSPKQALSRVKKQGDLFAPMLTLKQKLPAAFAKALAAGDPPKLHAWPRGDRGEKPKERGVRDKSLREYAAKRDPTQTPEPTAESGRRSETAKSQRGPLRFVIQKHDATRLHYDWRLEMEGVLRSWAVPKGPPTKPREARLAMHVEDHPMDYARFEGIIPKGNYGGGTVMVWDEGEYTDITGDAAAAYRAGKLHITMHGKKLNGEWIMVKDRRDEEGNRWLLIKAGKPTVISKKADDSSVISKRSMKQIAEAHDAEWSSSRAKKSEKSKFDEKLKRLKKTRQKTHQKT